MLRNSLGILTAIALTGTQVGAQAFYEGGETDPNATAAYAAITSTPLGSLPSSLPARMAGISRTGVTLRGQFGHVDVEGPISVRTIGFGTDVPIGRGSISVTAGLLDVGCDEEAIRDLSGQEGLEIEIDCKSNFIAGANWGVALLNSALVGGGTSSVVLGVDASVGFGTGDLLEVRSGLGPGLEVATRAVSASLGLPLALAARSGRATIVPHLAPRFAYGRLNTKIQAEGIPFFEDGGATESGTRFMLGGGIDVFFKSIGVNVGFQKVFIEDGDTVIGLGLSYGVR